MKKYIVLSLVSLALLPSFGFAQQEPSGSYQNAIIDALERTVGGSSTIVSYFPTEQKSQESTVCEMEVASQDEDNQTPGHGCSTVVYYQTVKATERPLRATMQDDATATTLLIRALNDGTPINLAIENGTIVSIILQDTTETRRTRVGLGHNRNTYDSDMRPHAPSPEHASRPPIQGQTDQRPQPVVTSRPLRPMPAPELSGDGGQCNSSNRPFPSFGVKNAKCLPSCGRLVSSIGGSSARALNTPCAQNGMQDAGEAYDVKYCCY